MIGAVTPEAIELEAELENRLGDWIGVEPDILVVLKANEGRLLKTFLDGPTDLVIEVISPDSVERDRIKKRNVYEAAGIPEYWLIDPERESAEFYQLADGRYQPTLIDALREIGVL